MARRPKLKSRMEMQVLPPNYFTAFKREAEVNANKVTRKGADQTVERAREILERQQFKWVPLDPQYKKYKKRKGLDERILIASRDYIDNGIGQYETRGKIFVGPMPGIHTPSGLSYVALSRIHEFGTWSIPARPLWRPLSAEMLREMPKLREEYYKGIARAHKRLLSRKKTVKR